MRAATGSARKALEHLRADAFDVAFFGRHTDGPEPFQALCRQAAQGTGAADSDSARRLHPVPWIAVKWLAVTERPHPLPGHAGRLLAPIKPAELREALLEALGDRLREPDRPSPAPPPVPAEDSYRAQLSILLAEDDAVNRTVILGMLERLGYSAEVAVNGLEALDALDRKRFDVVLLDVQMPELGGLETARRIRAARARSEGPWLIAVTANALRGDRGKCLAAGMDDYLSKPLKVADLAAALESCRSAVAAARLAAPPQPPSPSPSPGEPTEPPPRPIDAESLELDRAILDELLELDDGEGDILRETLEVFLSSTPERVDALETALAVGDFEAVERIAHTLKSSSAMVGGQQMSELCKRLEHGSAAGAVVEAPKLARGIGERFAALRCALTAELDRLAASSTVSEQP